MDLSHFQLKILPILTDPRKIIPLWGEFTS